MYFKKRNKAIKTSTEKNMNKYLRERKTIFPTNSNKIFFNNFVVEMKLGHYFLVEKLNIQRFFAVYSMN